MRPCYIQIKKGEKVPTKRGRRERTDWHLLETMQYEDTARLFVSLGGEPIETDFDFIKAIYDEYGEGIYSCVAGKKGRRGFWSFLLFEIKEDGTCFRFFRNNPFDKRRRQKRNDIIAELKELQSNAPLTDAAEIEKHIDDEFIGEEFDQMLNKIFIGGKRYGPFPYLRSTMKVGRHENLKPKQQPTPNFWGIGEKTEDEIEREEEQKQADEEEQKRFADSFKLFPDVGEE